MRLILLSLWTLGCPIFLFAQNPAHNVILFVPDGLRCDSVTSAQAPMMAALRDGGVNFANPHSLFPTFTTANASAMATGHYLGDTGDFGNTLYLGFPVPNPSVPGAGATLTPFLESDPVLGDVDEHFAGNYLDETTLIEAANRQGLSTAIIGKLGPALIFDHTERGKNGTIVVDDSTGNVALGVPLSDEIQQALLAAKVSPVAPSRGANRVHGDAKTPGCKVANVEQQDYFCKVATQVVLPLFKQRNKPFVLVFWSRDPDGTQHNQGDSLNQFQPGINGPTSLAAIRNADLDLQRLVQKVEELGLSGTTDIIISSDHGFSTISKQSKTSPSTKAVYADVPASYLPPGFLAIDLAQKLNLPLSDPDAKNSRLKSGQHPAFSNGLLGEYPLHPQVIVAANGGSDLIYIPDGNKTRVTQIVDFLSQQDYVSGLFVDDTLGKIPGTLPLSAINLKGSALTPYPAIVVNFASVALAGNPTLNAVEIADSVLEQGQGMHGSFSRADTKNFMAAYGPDFATRFTDLVPSSNPDIGKTIAQILGLKITDKGKLIGRILTEALPGGAIPDVQKQELRSPPDARKLSTVLQYQQVGETKYFDVAGYPGRSVGLQGMEP